MLDLALQNRAKKHQKSVPRGLQEPLGTDVCFTRLFKLHFGRFWLPTWAQHGPKNRSKIAQNPTWPPKGRQEASKDPFGAQLGPFSGPLWGQIQANFTRLGANFGPTSHTGKANHGRDHDSKKAGRYHWSKGLSTPLQATSAQGPGLSGRFWGRSPTGDPATEPFKALRGAVSEATCGPTLLLTQTPFETPTFTAGKLP